MKIDLLLIIFLVISDNIFSQNVTTEKIVDSGVSISIQQIERQEKFGDVQLLEKNKRKKIENENPFKKPINLPVPPGSHGETFQIEKQRSGRGRVSRPVTPLEISKPESIADNGLTFPALIDNDTSIPPDCAGAVGSNHIMTALNTEIKIQNKKGDSLLQVTLDGFFSPLTGVNNVFDPKLIYDKYANRWIITAVAKHDSPQSRLLLAVSESDDPTKNWRGYSFVVDSKGKRWADYPSIGINKNWIAVTVNMYGIENTDVEESDPYSKIFVFTKDSLYSKKSIVKVFGLTPDQGFTITPVLTQDNTIDTLYLVSLLSSNYNGKAYLQLYTITGDKIDPAYTRTNLTPNVSESWKDIPNNNGADFAPQNKTTYLLSNGDSRLQNAVYQNGSIWCANTAFFPATKPTHSAIVWWQVDPKDAKVQQFGKIEDASAKLFFAFPSIAVNKNQDVLIGYSSFSANQFASSNYSFIKHNNPTVPINVEFGYGLDKYYKTFGGPNNRWGDYTATVTDPDEISFWTLQQYAEKPDSTYDRWGTRWKLFNPENLVK